MTPSDIQKAHELMETRKTVETTMLLVQNGSEMILTIDRTAIKLTSSFQQHLRERIVKEFSDEIKSIDSQLAELGVSNEG